jgi:glutamine amidotransferase
MLAILDYGAGNQTSVLRALQSLGIAAVITDEPGILQTSHGVIFPGVGAAGQAMARLQSSGLDLLLRELVSRNKPLFGVCLGCQILLERSEENDTLTLGILPGLCRKFDPAWTDGGQPLRIPHMGWNSLKIKNNSGPNALLFEGIKSGDQFYFVHSYYTEPSPDLILATTTYGIPFAALYGRPGLWAAQFHPEKSGEPGLRLLANFDSYCREVAHG